ncbi:MAG: MFS transporter [Thalassolituus sp.]
MLQLVRPIFSLLTGVSLLLLGSGLLNTLLAVRGSAAGFSDQVMGLVMSGYFVGFFVGPFLALPVIRKVGQIRTFAMFAAIGSVSVLLHDIFDSPWAWGALRVVTGTALVILYTAIESWLNAQTPAQYRGQVFAIYMVVNLAALALSQQFLQLAPATGYILFVLASILVTLSLVPVTWTRFGPPAVQDVKRLSVRFLWRIAPVAVSAALLSGLAMGAFWGMSAVYATRIGLDTSSVAAYVTSGIIGGALLQLPVGRFSDRNDRRRVVMMIAGGAVFASLLLIPASYLGSYYLYAAIAIYGGLAFCIYPLAVAHLIDHLDSGDILAGGSALLLVHGIGATFGPALSGQLMTAFGANALPVYFAAMQALLVIVTVWKMHQRKTEETTGEPAQFVPMVRTTPTALEMHPDESEQISEPARAAKS